MSSSFRYFLKRTQKNTTHTHNHHKTSRRSILQMTGASLILPTALTGLSKKVRAEQIEANRHGGPYWLTIHAGGGWDPTLLCDPKGITSADDPAPINNYFTDEIEQVGDFLVPPVEGHLEFFQTFQNDLLVINGIDVGTNGHEQGTRATWSGGMDANRPSLMALIAGAVEPRPSLAFMSSGGYDYTAGLVPITRLPDTGTIQELAFPERRNAADPSVVYLHSDINSMIQKARLERLDRIQSQVHLPRTVNAMQVLQAARADDSELSSLIEVLPEEISSDSMEQQIQVALSCFSAGVSITSSLSIGGFDTHGNHDATHTPRLQQVLSAITFARQEAERLGITDRLYILVGSDFARTPHYNDGNGKDHWSITSMMMMGPDIQGGRVIGATDEDQLPRYVNPETLELDDNGVAIKPGNIHAALRRLAGIEENPIVTGVEVDSWMPILG